MKKIIFPLLIGVGFLSLSACNKNDAPTDPKPVAPQLATVASVTVDLPKNAATPVRTFYNDIYVSLSAALRHYESVKNLVPGYANSTWRWNYTAAGFDIKLEAVVAAGDSSSWKIWVSGNALNNWLSAAGKVSTNDRYGAWRFYLYNSADLQGSAIWRKNEQNGSWGPG